MKVLQVHNQYRYNGGENSVLQATISSLRSRGVAVSEMQRPGLNGKTSALNKVGLFFSGLYSLPAARDMRRILCEEDPDLVHVHNLYPLLSPSVLRTCRKAGLPVVMTCHNYRLVCPTTILFRNGRVCEECAGGREYRCVIRNCRNNFLESVAYATRNIFARKLGLFSDNVTLFISVSRFLKQYLIAAGLDGSRIAVVPNMIAVPDSIVDAARGKYIAFAGRMSEEKGLPALLSAAGSMPYARILVAGTGPRMDELRKASPRNVEFLGFLDASQMVAFYRSARFVVVPSRCFETFGLVAAEAMSHGLPVIASGIGALPEVIEDGVTGFLVESGNHQKLAEKMKVLWDDPDLCSRMGRAGREKAVREYGEDLYSSRLLSVYEQALALTGRSRHKNREV